MSSIERKSPPEIVYEDSGTGDAIVLLHGFLESSEIWGDFTEKLSGNFRVISIDLPGHGLSSVIDEVHSMDMMAEEVRNILEIIGVQKCVMVGHSMGGYVAMAFAARFKRFLRGVVLFHSHAAADSEDQKKNREVGIKAVENDHLGFISSFTPTLFAPENVAKYQKEIEWLRKIAMATPKEGILAAMKGMKDRADQVKTLEKFNWPVLVIAGDKDERIPIEKLKQQLVNVEKSKLEILKSVGHMGFIEAKDQTFKLIRNFTQSAFKKPKK